MANQIIIKHGIKTNLPILSNSELGFVTDEQELYIGTGSANIRILTEDDIYTDSDVDIHLSGGTGINYSSGVISTNDSEIDHNSLSNYSIDEHRTIDDTASGSTDLFSAQKITNDYKKYSGFENRTDSSIGMNGNNFEITTASSYNVYIKNIGKKTVSSTLSIEITEDQNITYIYLDWNGSAIRINKSTTPWNISDGTNIPLAIVFKDSTTYAVTDERHGYDRNLDWHEWAHNNIGALYNSGLAGTFTNTTLSITQGIIYDEDIDFDTGGTETTTSLWYRNATSGMRLVRSSSTPYSYIGSTIQYDDGSGTLQNVGNNNYYVSWIYASNDSTEPIYTVIGQGNHTNLNDARNESTPIINLSTAEWKLLYKVIYRNTATPTYIEAQDFRTVQNGAPTQSISPTSHTILTDRDASNQHPASSIQYDATTTVEEELDNKVDTTDSRLSDARTPTSHAIAGALHSSSTLADLNGKISDATLIDTTDSRLSDARTPTSHDNTYHSTNYTPETRTITSGTGLSGGGDLSANRTLSVDYGTDAGTACEGNDSRLSDARTPTSHTHGNISNDGKIGSTANLPIITGTDGILQASSFGTGANTFCEGDDSRLSDSREWTASTVSQIDAEAGTSTTRTAWTAERVKQAIDALGGGGGGLSWSVITSNTTGSNDNGYLINATSGNVTLTLPASPSAGDTIGVCDSHSQATTNTITIGRNSNNIESSAEDLIIDVDGSGFVLVYIDATVGWKIVSEVFSNTLKVGTVANKPIITTTDGVLIAGSFGTGANTFCEGDDSRLEAAIDSFSLSTSAASATFDKIDSIVRCTQAEYDEVVSPDDGILYLILEE